MDDEELVLTEADIDTGLSGDVLHEATVSAIIPKRGPVFDRDGTCGIAIIRPCVSRGARLRGLPPIYTPQMLESNRGPFSSALMYVDHLSESGLSESEIADLLAEARRARRVDEMGGRVINPRWDSNFVTKVDDDYGYRPGAIVARAKPVPRIREMIANDPELLHTSINAYPTSARKARAPWDPNVVGMLVEGIRSSPAASVDWVPRGGAGGHVLAPAGGLAEGRTTVALGGHHYSERHEIEGAGNVDLTNVKTPDELREAVAAENPALAEAAFPAGRPKVIEGAAIAPAGGISEERLTEMLEAQRETLTKQFEGKLAEASSTASDDVDERLAEARQLTQLEKLASSLIKKASLPKTMEAGLLESFGITEEGIGSGLLTEAEATLTPAEQVKERVKEQIKACQQILTEAESPLVEGLGGAKGAAQRRSSGAWREFLRRRSGGVPEGDDGEDDLVREMVSEGVGN